LRADSGERVLNIKTQATISGLNGKLRVCNDKGYDKRIDSADGFSGEMVSSKTEINI
jgi:hypothetical protein